MSWWSAPGRPGWTPDADIGTSFAWTFAGHSLGGWSRRLEEAPALDQTWPEASDARRPLLWSDSLRAASEALGAWLGPDAGLSTVSSTHLATHTVRARSIFRVDNGDFGVTRYSLMFERGDSLKWLRYQTSSGVRSGPNPLGPAGDHVWDLTLSVTRGMHTLRGNIGQRGAAQELKYGVVYEDAGAQSGRLEYRIANGGRDAWTAFTRTVDHRLDILSDAGVPVSYSRRDAQENQFELGGDAPFLGGVVAVRGSASRSRVLRTFDDAFAARDNSVWGALSFARPAGPGALRLELGGGNSTALDKRLIAPAASFSFGSGETQGRVFVQRLVHPVWSDLAPGQPSFLQSTTALGLDAQGAGGLLHARGALMAGTTRDRALVYPYPIEDVWLRVGVSQESSRYDFLLLTASGRADARLLGLGGEMFLLHRDQDPSEPRPEPDEGGRGWLEGRFRMFAGDLGVRLRLESAEVGARDSKTGGPPIALPAYWTSSALGIFTIADATVILSWHNLENVRHEESWIDPQTQQLALGPGRQFRLTLTWRLSN